MGDVYKRRSHGQNSDVERNVGMEQGGLIMEVEAEIKEPIVSGRSDLKVLEHNLSSIMGTDTPTLLWPQRQRNLRQLGKA